MIKLAEFLSGSRQTADQSRSPSAEIRRGSELASSLDQVPVEKVEIGPESRIVFHTDPRSPGADRIRSLRLRLREQQRVSGIHCVVVTSPLPGDGKSTIALNLATALAESGKRNVLLIEADLHH